MEALNSIDNARKVLREVIAALLSEAARIQVPLPITSAKIGFLPEAYQDLLFRKNGAWYADLTKIHEVMKLPAAVRTDILGVLRTSGNSDAFKTALEAAFKKEGHCHATVESSALSTLIFFLENPGAETYVTDLLTSVEKLKVTFCLSGVATNPDAPLLFQQLYYFWLRDTNSADFENKLEADGAALYEKIKDGLASSSVVTVSYCSPAHARDVMARALQRYADLARHLSCTGSDVSYTHELPAPGV